MRNSQLVEADVRAPAYGCSAREIVDSPQLRAEVRAPERVSDGNPYLRRTY